MRILNTSKSNIVIKVQKSDRFNDFKCMSFSNLGWELEEYSNDYRFVKTFRNNHPADYEIYRDRLESEHARIVFRARKSKSCFK